jgi:hypothetical protein
MPEFGNSQKEKYRFNNCRTVRKFSNSIGSDWKRALNMRVNPW